MSLDR